MAVGRALQQRLSAFGFDSFDHAWSEHQARQAAARRRPDLVVGDHLASSAPLEVAREVASANDAPMLAVTSNRFMFERAVSHDAQVEGAYSLSQLDAALASTGAF